MYLLHSLAQRDVSAAQLRIHDLRHYFASLLIVSGLDIKTVQARLRHASAKTTLDTYGHMWPDKDESSRAAIAKIMTAREDSLADSLRTIGGLARGKTRSEAIND